MQQVRIQIFVIIFAFIFQMLQISSSCLTEINLMPSNRYTKSQRFGKHRLLFSHFITLLDFS